MATATEQHPPEDDLHEAETHEDDDDEPKEWDEGGSSHCGYSEPVHTTLMSVGEKIHGVVGGPSESMSKGIKAIGNWFQEASYAIRDFMRGDDKEGMKEDTNRALKTLMTGEMHEDEDEDHKEEKENEDQKPEI